MIDIKIIHFKPIPLTEDWLLRFGLKIGVEEVYILMNTKFMIDMFCIMF
jgi:hypothetical protein